MGSIFDKLKDVIFDPEPDNGQDEALMDSDASQNEMMETAYDDATAEPSAERESARENRGDRRRLNNPGGNKVVNMDKPNLTAVNGAGTMKMILFQPLSFEDSQAIVDNLRARKPVIVNMVDLERELAQRVIDFMSGAVYALSGTIRRVSYGIFVIVPSNITIVGDGEDEDRELFRS